MSTGRPFREGFVSERGVSSLYLQIASLFYTFKQIWKAVCFAWVRADFPRATDLIGRFGMFGRAAEIRQRDKHIACFRTARRFWVRDSIPSVEWLERVSSETGAVRIPLPLSNCFIPLRNYEQSAQLSLHAFSFFFFTLYCFFFFFCILERYPEKSFRLVSSEFQLVAHNVDIFYAAHFFFYLLRISGELSAL